MKSINFDSFNINFRQNVIITFCLSIIFTSVFSEGTKELRPTEASFGSLNLMDSRNGLDKERTFALYSATDETRLNIRITDFNNEIVYLGFNVNGTDDLFFRIKDPNGNVVFGPQLVPQADGDLGKIIDYDEAVFGPDVLGVAGYSPIVFTPTMAGDYSIEFDDPDYDPTNGDYPKRSMELFDITVYDNSLSEVKNGRLWSNAWDLTTKGGSNEFDGSVFIYTDDGITTKANFDGFQPFSFIIQSNSTGPSNTGDLISDRQSTTDGVLLPEYMIFLNEPDPIEFPPSVIPEINSVPAFDFCNITTDQCIEIELSNPGEINYIIDIAGGPGFDDPRDLSFEIAVDAGLNCLPWDGLDGEGNSLLVTDTFNIILNYRAGITHLFIYDAENNSNGFNVEHVSPVTGLGEPFLFYDDTELSGGSDFIGCNSNCHTWDGNFGNDETVNTWWVTFFENDTIKDISIDFNSNPSSVDILIKTPIECGGNSMELETFNVENAGDSPSYSWYINGVLEANTSTFNPTGLSEGDAIWAVVTPSDICFEPDTAQIIIALAKEPILTNDTTVCVGDSVTLTANNINGFFRWLVDGEEISRDTIIKVLASEEKTYVAENGYVPTSSNLIVNGDFEDGFTGFISDYTISTMSPISNGGIMIGSNGKDALDPFFSIEDHSFGALSDMLMVDGDLVDGSTVYQTSVDVVSGSVYNFSLWAVSLFPTNPAQLQFFVNDVPLDNFSLDGTAEWRQFDAYWESDVTGSVDIKIVNRVTAGGGNDFALDDLLFATVDFCRDDVTVSITDSIEAEIDLSSVIGCPNDLGVVYVQDTLNLGLTPSYEWYLNGVEQLSIGDTLLLTNLTDNDSVSVIATSSLTECIIRNDTSSTSVAVFSKPNLSISSDVICEGDTAVLTSSITGETNPVVYEWTVLPSLNIDDLTNVIAFPDVTTTYELMVEDDNGCRDTTDYELVVNSKPEVAVFGNDMCAGDTTTLTTVVTNHTGVIVYDWVSSLTLSELDESEVEAFPLVNTTYELRISDDNGCKDTTIYDQVVNNKPVVSVSGNPICEGETAILTSSVSGQTDPVTYTWVSSSTLSALDQANVDASPEVNTTYELRISDDNGCKDTTTYDQVVNTNPVVTIKGDDICGGASSTLISNVTNHTGTISYDWSNGSTLDRVTVAPTSTTTYELEVLDGNNCKGDTSFTVGVTSSPTANIIESGSSICDDVSLILNASNDPLENYTFSWQSSEDNVSFSSISNTTSSNVVSETGYYRVEVMNDGFCPELSASVFVNVIKTEVLKVSLDPISPLCEGEDVKVKAEIENGGALPVISWVYSEDLSLMSSTDEIAINDLIASNGFLNVTVESSLDCVDESDDFAQVDLKVLAKPTPEILSENDTICDNDFTSLEAQELVGGSSYEWSLDGVSLQGETSLTLSDVNQGGSYVFSATNGVCPVVTDTVSVLVLEIPFVDASESLNNIEEYLFGDEITLVGSHEGESSVWIAQDLTTEVFTSFSNETLVQVPGGGVYVFTLTSSNGSCSASDSVIVDVKLPIKAPNVFTPNGDGENETFHIEGIETHPDAIVTIMNRWGVVIYEEQNYIASEWDAQDTPDGVYYFLISFPDQEEGMGYTGAIHVLR